MSFGFLCSRQGSELARDIISSNAFLCLPILSATACTSSVRAGSAACAAGRFRPSPPPGTCQTSLPNAPHLRRPILMAKFPSSPPQKALAMQVLFSFERGASHPWLTRVVRRRLVFPAHLPVIPRHRDDHPTPLTFHLSSSLFRRFAPYGSLRRHGSEPARNISQMRVALLFIFLEARRSFMRAGSAAAQPSRSFIQAPAIVPSWYAL